MWNSPLKWPNTTFGTVFNKNRQNPPKNHPKFPKSNCATFSYLSLLLKMSSSRCTLKRQASEYLFDSGNFGRFFDVFFGVFFFSSFCIKKVLKVEFGHFCKGEFHRNDFGCDLTSLNHKKNQDKTRKIAENHSKSLKTTQNREKLPKTRKKKTLKIDFGLPS